MKHFIFLLVLAITFSCAENSDENNVLMKQKLLKHQWELKDTNVFIGAPRVEYDYRLLIFDSSDFNLSQKTITVELNEKLNDTLNIVINGQYSLDYPYFNLFSKEMTLNGKMYDDKLEIWSYDSTSRKLYFHKK